MYNLCVVQNNEKCVKSPVKFTRHKMRPLCANFLHQSTNKDNNIREGGGTMGCLLHLSQKFFLTTLGTLVNFDWLAHYAECVM